jgi:hypothetical protein
VSHETSPRFVPHKTFSSPRFVSHETFSFSAVSLAGDGAFFYDGYLAVEGIAVWGHASRQEVNGESVFRFVGTETDSKSVVF